MPSKKLTLFASDLAALYGALALVLLLRYGPGKFAAQWHTHALPFTLLFTAWIFAFYITNLYERRSLRNAQPFYGALAQAGVIAAVISIAFFYLVPLFGIAPRLNLFLFIIAASALLVGFRSIFNALLARGTKKRVLIIGASAESIELAKFITDNPQLGYRVHGLVSVGQEPLLSEAARWSLLDSMDAARDAMIRERIDTAVISPSALILRDVVQLCFSALARQVDFVKLATFSEQLTGQVPLGAIDQAWFLDNITEGSKKSFEVFKRGTDIIAGTLLGAGTLLLLPFVAAAIKLTSRGPVFFTQTRTGRNGIPFVIHKFRSMRVNAEAGTGAVWAQNNDPRVTRVGNFLRKTRIDELPQLWNILRGDMSLVGPRAERPEFDATLAREIPFYQERYLVRPGLSGWAQINYPYGASVHDALQKLQYDLYYIKHRSPALDIAIILKTITIALRRAGR